MKNRGKTQDIDYRIKGIKESHQRLAVAVIVQACKDLRGFKLKYEGAQGTAWDWFFDDSGSYWFWCEVAGVDGCRLRRKLLINGQSPNAWISGPTIE
jgi:hypothetical protein